MQELSSCDVPNHFPIAMHLKARISTHKRPVLMRNTVAIKTESSKGNLSMIAKLRSIVTDFFSPSPTLRNRVLHLRLPPVRLQQCYKSFGKNLSDGIVGQTFTSGLGQ